ncbi:CLUMA_CG013840, isoform A [Clunio marinus]|uniref:CLUMA_CG013840, isoform A n=1 Tax=Clunio marinus TaxID=568069 RepID=A0A1J1ILY9_9DIPT|nr:CLUMA_CG013840, isoform A [Clunio marinus]
MTAQKKGVEIPIQSLEFNPKCRHGPTILFSVKNSDKKYFSCSCQRDHECFYMDFNTFSKKNLNDICTDDNQLNGKKFNSAENNKTESFNVSYSELLALVPSQRTYCKTCEIFTKIVSAHKTHKYIEDISDKLLKEPSLFLPQLDNDTFNAQYFFDSKTLQFINKVFEDLKFQKIVCLGAPRLHDFFRSKEHHSVKTILLDIDKRFKTFNYSEDFIHYNMLNHFFFDGMEDEEKLIKFLKDDDQIRSNICLFTDPPFAARTELLTWTIRQISNMYNKANCYHKVLPILWVFPYFNELHIKKEMPEMEMLDFQVTYMNHKAFREGFKGRKAGSPIRIFTNIEPKYIKYPENFKDYRFCNSCKKFVSISNVHCNICKACPSKNGSTYRHCTICILCVKPNYIHCPKCNRCVPKVDHDCSTYQQHQTCWLCDQKGHVETFCRLNKNNKKGKLGKCFTCKIKKFHNVRNCPLKKMNKFN